MTEFTSDQQPKPPPAADDPSPIASFTKWIGEYKELISVLIFFAGGVLWAFAYFATKQQISELKCLMNANVNIVQGKMDSSTLSQLMLDNVKRTSQLDGTPNPTADQVVEKNQLKTAAPEIARKIAEAETNIAKALDKLKSGECLGD
jgi:hypothetical protein